MRPSQNPYSQLPTIPSMEEGRTASARLVDEIHSALDQSIEYQISLPNLIRRSLAMTDVSVVSEHLARHWVRNAAGFIFSNPERWLVELVLNGIDSTQAKSFGQNGIGFFSCLSNLKDSCTTPLVLRIETKSSDDAYSITLSGEAPETEAIFCTLEEFIPLNAASTGTRMLLSPVSKERAIDDVQISRYAKVLQALQFHSTARIELLVQFAEGDEQRQIIGRGASDIPPQVAVTLSPKGIEIVDRGSGIPLGVAVTKLLVPSETTKERRAPAVNLVADVSDPISLEVYLGKDDPKQSRLLVCAGDVIVTNRAIRDSILDADGTALDVLIRLPAWCRYTLDGEEILLDRPNTPEERYIRALIENSVARAVSQCSPEESRLLSGLFVALQSWEESSASQVLSKGLFSQFMKQSIQRALTREPAVIPIPEAAYEAAFPILSSYGARLLPIHPDTVDHEFNRLDEFLYTTVRESMPTNATALEMSIVAKALSGTLIDGVAVHFVEDDLLPKTHINKTPKITAAGLKNTLFVPRSLMLRYLDRADQVEAVAQLAREILYRYPEGGISMKVETPVPTQHTDRVSDSLLECLVYTNQCQWQRDEDHYPTFRSMVPGKWMTELIEAPILTEDMRVEVNEFWTSYCEALAKSKKGGFENSIFAQFRAKEVVVAENDFVAESHLAFSEVVLELFELQEEFPSPSASEIHDRTRWITKYPHFIVDTDLKTVREVQFSHLLELGKKFVAAVEKDTGRAQSRTYWLQLDLKQKDQMLDSYLEEALASESFTTSVDPLTFCNYLVTDLLCRFNLLPIERIVDLYKKHDALPDSWSDKKQAQEMQTTPFLCIGSETSWPLPQNPSGHQIARLYGVLLCKHVDTKFDGVSAIAKRRALQLPGKEKDPVLQTIGDSAFPVPIIRVPIQSPALLTPVQDSISKLGFVARGQPGVDSFVEDGHILKRVGLSTALCAIVASQESFADETRLAANQLNCSLQNLYHRLLLTPPGEFYGGYGSARKISATPYWFDGGQIGEHFEFLQSLAQYPAQATKLLYLCRNHLSALLTPEMVKSFNARQSFPVFCLLADSPITHLTWLRKNGMSLDAIAALIECCETPAQLDLIHTLLFRWRTRWEISEEARRSAMEMLQPEQMTLFIRLFIQEKLDAGLVDALYKAYYLACDRGVEDPEIRVSSASLQREFEGYLDGYRNVRKMVSNRAGICDGAIIDRIKCGPTINLSQLISAHSRVSLFEAVLKEQDLAAALSIVAEQLGGYSHNKIRQNIEVGSERDPVQGIVIECVQNSSDEVRAVAPLLHSSDETFGASYNARLAAGIKEPQSDALKIEVEASVVGNSNEVGQVGIEVRDRIGMRDLGVLLTDFLLPDFSRKGDNSGNVGTMGNGLARLYTQATEAYVQTRLLSDPAKIYGMLLKPVRSLESGEVIDVSFQVADISGEVLSLEPSFFGTSIRALLLPEQSETALLSATYARFSMIHTLGALSVRDERGRAIEVFLRNGDLTVNRLNVFQSISLMPQEIFTIKDTEGLCIHVYKMKDGDLPTVISTGGVPFGKLSALEELLPKMTPEQAAVIRSGFVFDIPVGAYEPVQSRTRLRLSPASVEALREAVLQTYFSASMIAAGAGSSGTDWKRQRPGMFIHGDSAVTSLRQVRVIPEPNLASRASCEGPESLTRPQFFTHFPAAVLRGTRFPTVAHFLQDGCDSLSSMLEIVTATWTNEEGVSNRGRVSALKETVRLLFDTYVHELLAQERIIELFNDPVDATPKRITEIQAFLQLVVVPWFEDKIQKFGTFNVVSGRAALALREPTVRPITSPNCLIHPTPQQFRAMGVLISEALTLLTQHHARLTKESRGVALVVLGEDKPLTAARYDSRQRRIALNVLGPTKVTSFLRSVFAACEWRLYSSAPFVSEWLVPGPSHAGSLNHELAHHRYPENKGHSPEVDVFGDLVSFEQCAAGLAQCALEDGLLVDWMTELPQHLLRVVDKETIDWVESHLPELEYLEHDDRLGFVTAVIGSD